MRFRCEHCEFEDNEPGYCPHHGSALKGIAGSVPSLWSASDRTSIGPVATDRCPGENLLSAFAEGLVSDGDRRAIRTHLEDCPDCLALVDAIDPGDLDSLPDAGPGESNESEHPQQVGPYRLLERIGAGAMGIVYRAEDLRDSTEVALKLAAHKVGSSDELGQRLLREGHMLRRVQDPHVVPVIDVGTVDHRVYVAMEFVRGVTLKDWVAEVRASVPSIVSLFVQAAEGLAAAHEAGVVHRDFKPSNVLVDNRGVVRVMDFGLARLSRGQDAARTIENTMTTPGILLGTPSYMSPEQLGGLPADELSDQFSFCVALYECIYGHRPFRGGSVKALRLESARGRISFPAQSEVPAALEAILFRGLRPRPRDRFPSMRALSLELAQAI